MDPIVYFEREKFRGRTSFSPRLLRDAITVAAQNTTGVHKTQSNFAFFMAAPLRNNCRGVRIRPVGYNSLIVEICIVAKAGYTASDISYRIQEAVLGIAQAQKLSDRRIKRVDVKIANVA